MFRIGVKFLCHGYVIVEYFLYINALIISSIFMSWLCDYVNFEK